MCGISGIADLHATRPVQLALAEDMNRALAHRGPDDSGLWAAPAERTALAHRRLSIIDPSPAGHQPMADAEERLHIVFNGEIYNFQELRRELAARGARFQTSGDTEVILQAYRAWGVDCVKHFVGMFAFAVYDFGARRLFLARDRAGEKPLFYHRDATRLVFASELKALLAAPHVPRRLDPVALDFYLAYGYVPGERCMLAGVKKLPAAHAMVFDLATGESRTWRYWHLPEHDAHDSASESELVDELERLLDDSVRRQLVADVPLGIMLSGGIDSSLVTAMAARASSRPVQTFNVSFPGHGGHDESAYARLVARHFGTNHTEIAAQASSVDLLPKLAEQFDEPIADSSMLPTFLVAQDIRRHATVALGGDGGDELFGGYAHHRWLVQLARLRGWMPPGVRAALGPAAKRFLPVGLRGRNLLLALLADASRGIAQFNLYFDDAARRQLLSPAACELLGSSAPEDSKVDLCRGWDSTLQNSTRVDFLTYLADDILVKVDRASMLASLEVRAPWLDHRLVEFAFRRVPDHLKATYRERKILPRRLAQRLLPRQLDLNRKQGFSLPLEAWMRGPWRPFVQDVLGEADPRLFNRGAIDRLVVAQRRGYAHAQRLFSLTIFELWRRHYGVTL